MAPARVWRSGCRLVCRRCRRDGLSQRAQDVRHVLLELQQAELKGSVDAGGETSCRLLGVGRGAGWRVGSRYLGNGLLRQTCCSASSARLRSMKSALAASGPTCPPAGGTLKALSSGGGCLLAVERLRRRTLWLRRAADGVAQGDAVAGLGRGAIVRVAARGLAAGHRD